MRCGPTKKLILKSENSAKFKIQEILSEETNRNSRNAAKSFRYYKCEYCGFYHLTTKTFDNTRESAYAGLVDYRR